MREIQQIQGKPTARIYQPGGWKVRTWNSNTAQSLSLAGAALFEVVKSGQSAEIGAASSGQSLAGAALFSIVKDGQTAEIGAGSAGQSLAGAALTVVIVDGGGGQPAEVGTASATHSLAGAALALVVVQAGAQNENSATAGLAMSGATLALA